MSKSFIEQSKTQWCPSKERQATTEEITIGCMQRIATATEAMAINHVNLQKDRDQYKRWYEEEARENKALKNTNRSLRSWITRLKNQAGKQ